MKKGFTLIELLAIILLISIILGISAPQIFKIVNLYNKESSEAAEDILVTAAKEYVEVYNRSILFDVKNLNDCKMISTDDIRDLGLIKQSHLDLIYENQSFYVKITLLQDNIIKYEVSENLDITCGEV
jgi:prepilin-type N-terminal cleavage/methylation domain-containing protein